MVQRFILIFLISSLFAFSYGSEDDFKEFTDPDDETVEQIIEDPSVKEQKIAEKNAESKLQDHIKPGDSLEKESSVSQDNERKREDDDEPVVETEEEDQNLHDSEEFEGIDKKNVGKPVLEIVKVPHHLTSSWETYYLELLMIAGLVVYMANFVMGKNKNTKLANAWFESHRELLEMNFSLVGDDGQPTPTPGILNKESENVYSLWCSGRVYCEGMLVEIKLLKRQDLLSFITKLMRPMNDQIIVKVILDEGEMDGFVMCLTNRKKVNSLIKEYQDLATFCPEKKTPKNGIPESFVLLSEIPEASAALIDAKVQRIFKEYEDNIEFMHISDQFTGPATTQEEQNATRLPEIKKCLLFGFKVGNRGSTTTHQMESLKPLFNFIFYMIDKVHRVKLSKEAKLKSEKNRQKAMDTYEKSVHLQRQEAAQQRRVEKIRQEKEKLMAEEDPEKARKLELSTQKREAKGKQPKMKMLKIKA